MNPALMKQSLLGQRLDPKNRGKGWEALLLRGPCSHVSGLVDGGRLAGGWTPRMSLKIFRILG